MILKTKNSKEKYNGFWKWLFYTELLVLIALIVAFVVIEKLRRNDYNSFLKGTHCSSAVNCVDNGDDTRTCQYYTEEGVISGETIVCAKQIRED